jgi:hypothetical protein
MAADFTPVTDEQLSDHRTLLSALLRTSDGRELTAGELTLLLPPRAPQGHYQNRVRGAIVAALNRAGFTSGGKRIA